MKVYDFESIKRVNILGVYIQELPLEGLINFICNSCLNHHKVILAYVNVHALNLACQIGWFREFLNRCDLVFCDGFGVKWAAQLLYHQKLYRHTPPDWIPLLAQEFSRQQLSMYFLGAKPGVAQKAADVLRKKTPGVNIVGMHHGYFDKSPQSQEQQAIIAEINQLHPDLLVLGFGMPNQEKWIEENWSNLNVTVVLPAGAMFDYLAGDVVRVPRWMTDHGLEWLGRLIIEPRRLWRRYILGNPIFLWRVLLQRLGLLQFK